MKDAVHGTGPVERPCAVPREKAAPRHRSRHAAASAGARIKEKHKYGNIYDLLSGLVPTLCTIILILALYLCIDRF